MKIARISLSLLTLVLGRVSVFADTPTITPTVELTATPSITPTEVVVSRVRLDHNRFNPLKGEIVSVLGLTSLHGKVTIRVFNQQGQLIRDLLKNEEPGAQVPAWDGRNQDNEVVASGVYIIIITGNKLNKHSRVVILK